MSRIERTSFDDSASTELETWRSDRAWWDQLATHLQDDGWDATVSTTKAGEHACSVSVPPLHLRLGADIYRAHLWPALYVDSLCLPSVLLGPVVAIRGEQGSLCPARAAQRVTEVHLRDVKRLARVLALRPGVASLFALNPSAGEATDG